MSFNKTRGKIIVIGGGVSGLASAALLSKQGWDVTLLEKNKDFGGRARVLREKGFMFDMGPSWYLMPEVFDNFFMNFGKKTEDYYELIPLDPKYKIFFDERGSYSFKKDISKDLKWFDLEEKDGAKKLTQYLERSRKAYQASIKLIYQDIGNPLILFKLRNLRLLFEILSSLRFWQSWNSYVSTFFKSEKIKKVLGFHSVFLGGSPFNTPCLYTILSWADFKKGVWYPKGGMRKVIEALISLAIENGVELKSDIEVKKIEVKDGYALGVQTSKGFFPADLVVVTSDLAFTETNLLEKKYRTYDKKYWQDKTLGISALLIYLGLKGSVKNLEHHNIYLAKDWQENFSEIFKKRQIPKDPSFYISVRTKRDKSIAPKGCEEIFVLVPLASKEEYSQKGIEILYEKVIGKIEFLTKEKIKEKIVFKKIFTPNDFKKDYLAYQGTALGLAHTFSQSLWLRPGNKSKKVANLYYAGQYTNPGVGVPMCLISAQILAKKIGHFDEFMQEIFKKGSTTYYYSSLFFKDQIKRDVFCLYAYVRTIDNLVDTTKPKKDELNRMYKDTIKAWSGERVKSKLIQAFLELAKRKGFEWKWIKAFWQSMMADLNTKNYRLQELNEYMFGSAEVVGLMMAKILDLPEKAAPFARLQGKAMQLINFIRDIKEDMDLGRNYLGYKESWVKNSKKWNKFIRGKIDEFFSLQKEAEKGYRFIPKRYLIPIKTASDMYKWTAKKIYKNPQIVLAKKVKPNKFQVILRAILNYFIIYAF